MNDSDFKDDLLGALEEISDALKASKAPAAPEVKPVINIPQQPAPVVQASPVTVKPEISVPQQDHPFANGFRVGVSRDHTGLAMEYTFRPL